MATSNGVMSAGTRSQGVRSANSMKRVSKERSTPGPRYSASKVRSIRSRTASGPAITSGMVRLTNCPSRIGRQRHLPLEASPGSDYFHSERIEGSKHFGVWPLWEGAQAYFGTPHWPEDCTVPEMSLEFEVHDADAVGSAAEPAAWAIRLEPPGNLSMEPSTGGAEQPLLRGRSTPRHRSGDHGRSRKSRAGCDTSSPR